MAPSAAAVGLSVRPMGLTSRSIGLGGSGRFNRSCAALAALRAIRAAIQRRSAETGLAINVLV